MTLTPTAVPPFPEREGEGTHTPGPWGVRTYRRSDVVNIRGLDDAPVAQVAWMPETGMAVTMANARLIAAAPDLLAALEALTEEAHRNVAGGAGHLIDDARAAIAKTRLSITREQEG